MHAFCARLVANASLGDANAAASLRSDRFDVRNSLAGLIAMGAVVGYDLAADHHD